MANITFCDRLILRLPLWQWIMCAPTTGGNLHPFQRQLTFPLHSPNGRQMPAATAVQGDCERVLETITASVPNGFDVLCFLMALWSVLYACMRFFSYWTQWGRDKMAAISQTTFSNAFSWTKMYEFLLRFHWSLFLSFELTIFQHKLIYWIGTDQATNHYLNQRWLFTDAYMRHSASVG